VTPSCPIPSHPSTRARGFSLIEMLLALSVLIMLVSAFVVELGPTLRTGVLEETARQVESFLIFAGVESSSLGREVRARFEGFESTSPTMADSGSGSRISLLVETGRIGSRQFVPLPPESGAILELAAAARLAELRDLDAIDPAAEFEGDRASTAFAGTSVAVVDPPTNSTQDSPRAQELPDVSMARELSFYPDGSCQNAEIILEVTEPEPATRVGLRLIGVTGRVERFEVEISSLDVLPEADAASVADDPSVGESSFDETETDSAAEGGEL
jgi:prepilin-type N-terminal cleavage/methylation domain-containing protein